MPDKPPSDNEQVRALWQAFAAGYEHGYEDGRDDAYVTKPILRQSFRTWLRDRDAS